MAARQTQHDAADARYRAIIETLDTSRNDGTVTGDVLEVLARHMRRCRRTSRTRGDWDGNVGLSTSTAGAWSIDARRSSRR
jgi:hypothetical protein